MDTGPLYASFDADDRNHAKSRALLEEHDGPLIVPMLVVTEVVSLMSAKLGSAAESAFIQDLTGGVFVVDALRPSDWTRIRQLLVEHRDLGLGTVDASIVATAERLQVTTIATLDERHFRAIRPTHVPHFDLLP